MMVDGHEAELIMISEHGESLTENIGCGKHGV